MSRWLLLLLTAATTLGCHVDTEQACGPAMRYDAELFGCVCTDDAIQTEGGCEPCAPDEIPVAGACACPAGEAKDGNNVCVAVPGLGDSCDASRPCTDAVYNLCAGPEGNTTCTRLCAVDEDCTDTYVCADWEPTPSCRTYTGVLASCAVSADCAGYDADTCLQGYCLVTGCTVGVEDCPRGMECCDLSAFALGTACVPPGVCP